MSRKLLIVLLVAFVGFVSSFPSQDEKTNDANKVADDDESRIVGGSPASANQFPYMVSIQMLTPSLQWFPMCGGSVISKRTILTAAHCLDPPPTSPMRIVAGSLHSTSVTSAGQIRNVAAYKVHEAFQRDQMGRLFNDIALIILEQPLTFTASVQPIALAKEPPVVGNTGTAAGWGDTVANVPGTPSSQLLYIPAQIDPLSDCEAVLGPLHAPSQICIGSTVSPTNAFMQTVCRGDSGGPVVMGHAVQGVVSYSTPECGKAKVVFTSIYFFSNWIRISME